MRIFGSLFRRHRLPWYYKPFKELTPLSKLNLPPPPKLRIDVQAKHRKLSRMTFEHMGGPKLRLEELKYLVINLLRFERVETSYSKGDECRGYVERLIRDAVDLGDKHIPTMEMASWWLQGNEDLVHKLFKVLAPRYKNISTSVTQLYKRSSDNYELCVLELRDNPLPPMKPFQRDFKYTLSNVLLDQLRKDIEGKEQSIAMASNQKQKCESEELNCESDMRGIPLNINDPI